MILPVVALTVVSIVMGYFCFTALRDVFVSDDELRTHTGEVISADVVSREYTTRDSDTGARETTSKDFFNVKLNGLARTLSAYNFAEDYRSMVAAVHHGDVVTAVYETPDDEELTLTIYKLEKNGNLVIDDSGKIRQKVMAFIMAVGIGVALWKALSIWRKN